MGTQQKKTVGNSPEQANQNDLSARVSLSSVKRSKRERSTDVPQALQTGSMANSKANSEKNTFDFVGIAG